MTAFAFPARAKAFPGLWRLLAALAPERQFLLVAGLAGLILAALIPPLGGGNERFNFQRTAMVATGRIGIEPLDVPGGVPKLLAANRAQFSEGRAPPYRYTGAQLGELAAIALDAGHPAVLQPNPIAILNPVAYLPQTFAYKIGEAFGLPPLMLFYLGRLAGLAAGLALTFFAIREMPVRARSLAILAMLPTILFSRATLDADQVTNGLAFLFVAVALKAALGDKALTWRRIALLIALGFFEAQCKTAYMVLLPLALAIPAARYGSRLRWALASAAIILPGLALSLAWMVSLKHGYFAGMTYTTWAGTVDPDRQAAMILADPLGYVGVALRTVFDLGFLSQTLVSFIGIFGPPVTLPAPLLALTFAAAAAGLASEGGGSAPKALKSLALGTFFAGTGLVLTLLYVQWTGLGGPVILGFQGRYLYPLAPAMLLWLPQAPLRAAGLAAGDWQLALGLVSSGGVLWLTAATYWL